MYTQPLPPTRSRILEDLLFTLIGILLGGYGMYECLEDHPRPAQPPAVAQSAAQETKAEAAPKTEAQSLSEAEQAAAKLKAALEGLPPGTLLRVRDKRLRESIRQCFEALETGLRDTVEGTDKSTRKASQSK